MFALISVSDKRNLEGFAKELRALGYEILSTGGTYRYLESYGIPAKKVEDITKFPEILGGRVKTLHPAIHGGILAKSEEDLKELGIEPISIVVVNLYPFEKYTDASEEEMVENIDIGGVALLRAAAKNYSRVLVVSSPEQYDEVITLLKLGEMNEEKRREYAMEAFAKTASYDILIYNTLWNKFKGTLPEHFMLSRRMAMELRYGENPHQKASYYSSADAFVQHHGKKLSFNNLYDMDSAYTIVNEFEQPACVVVKHANPCGAAIGENVKEAFEKAWNGDPMSAYGSIVAFNHEVNEEVASLMRKKFIEVVVAPKFTDESLEILKKKKNLRIVEMKNPNVEKYDLRQLHFGLLVQEWNTKKLYEGDVVSKRMPTENEMKDMLFAWSIVKHVKSNAIVFAKDGMLVGVGAGQMSRVDSVRIAAMKAGERAKGAVMASDAFFPFRDGIDEAHKAGVTAVIQPGGSIRDEEVIKAVDEHGMAMIFTSYRVFKH